MNKAFNEFVRQNTVKFRRLPQMTSSKAQIHAKCHKIPIKGYSRMPKNDTAPGVDPDLSVAYIDPIIA
jgi:hypothetical protein